MIGSSDICAKVDFIGNYTSTVKSVGVPLNLSLPMTYFLPLYHFEQSNFGVILMFLLLFFFNGLIDKNMSETTNGSI